MTGYGPAQTPTVTVKYGSTKLTQGSDYTVSYYNNTQPCTAKVEVTLQGQYTGTLTAYFHIADFDLVAQPWWVAPPKEGETITVTLNGYLDGVDVTDDSSMDLSESYTGVTLEGNILTISSDFTGNQVRFRGEYKYGGLSSNTENYVTVSYLSLLLFQLESNRATFDGMPHKPRKMTKDWLQIAERRQNQLHEGRKNLSHPESSCPRVFENH